MVRRGSSLREEAGPDRRVRIHSRSRAGGVAPSNALSRRSGQSNAQSNNQLLLGKRKPNDSQAAVRARLDGRPSPREERILAEERSKAQQAVTE